MKKIAIFVFNGAPMCFMHVILNGLDMQKRGYEVRIILEGVATKLVGKLEKPDHSLHQLWQKAREAELIEGACMACSRKMGVLDQVKAADIPLMDELNGHPGMARYLEEGFELLTF